MMGWRPNLKIAGDKRKKQVGQVFPSTDLGFMLCHQQAVWPWQVT